MAIRRCANAYGRAPSRAAAIEATGKSKAMGMRYFAVWSCAIGLAAFLGSLRSAAYAEMHNVNVGSGFSIVPEDVAIRVGDTVHWKWVGGVHDVESGVGGKHHGNPDVVIDVGDLPAVVSAFFSAPVCPDPRPGSLTRCAFS